MRFMQRAFLYVIRKKGKSVLLLVILLVIATFVLAGLSIERASTKARDNLRRSLGGVFEVTPDFTEANPYFRMDSDGEGNTNLYTELPVTEDIINAIMGIEGILSCNAESKCFISAKLDIFPGNVPLKPDYKDKVYARIVAGTENNSLFQSGTVKLKEGRHMTGNDNYAAVISSDLAQKNHLGIGDSISLQGDENAEVKIVGIFEILKPDSIIESITTYDRLENQIFTGLDTYERLIPGQAAGYLSAEFKVSDPARLDTVLSQVENISTIDWRVFTITQDNETYLEAAAPLSELQSLVTALLMVIIIVSAVILTLILTMWGRTRIHETGVLLSFGIGKSEIISQYLAEVLLIAVFAFGLSYFTGSAAAGQLANVWLQRSIEFSGSSNSASGEYTNNVKDGISGVEIKVKDSRASSSGAAPQDEEGMVQGQSGTITDIGTGSNELPGEPELIHVSIGLDDMMRLYGIGFVLIALSVAVSSGTVMRLKPREILAKMN